VSKRQREAANRWWRETTLGGSTLEEMRAGFTEVMARFPMPAGVATTNVTLARQRALRIKPSVGGARGTILYLHGGSWVVGAPETAMALTAHLVLRTGVTALSLDYRLAPEHPFPAAIDDVTAAYRALLDDGTDPATVVLAGDSAGGGLAITGLLAARREGLPMPAAVITFSPSLDATRSGSSMGTKAARDPVFSPNEVMAAVDQLYLAGADPRQELLSPALHADLAGFPPLLLQVGTNEILLDDSVRMAARAAAADADVILDVTADVPHVFQSFAGELDEADRALDRAAAFVLEHLRA
jgi:acetyl esterase/lipase